MAQQNGRYAGLEKLQSCERSTVDFSYPKSSAASLTGSDASPPDQRCALSGG